MNTAIQSRYQHQIDAGVGAESNRQIKLMPNTHQLLTDVFIKTSRNLGGKIVAVVRVLVYDLIIVNGIDSTDPLFGTFNMVPSCTSVNNTTSDMVVHWSDLHGRRSMTQVEQF